MKPEWLGSPHHVAAGALLTSLAMWAVHRRIGPPFLLALFGIGVTAAAELVIEIIEYPLLYGRRARASAYYDTLADMAGTMAGSALAAVVVVLVLRQRSSANRGDP